jgi:hypothetical protein
MLCASKIVILLEEIVGCLDEQIDTDKVRV